MEQVNQNLLAAAGQHKEGDLKSAYYSYLEALSTLLSLLKVHVVFSETKTIFKISDIDSLFNLCSLCIIKTEEILRQAVTEDVSLDVPVLIKNTPFKQDSDIKVQKILAKDGELSETTGLLIPTSKLLLLQSENLYRIQILTDKIESYHRLPASGAVLLSCLKSAIKELQVVQKRRINLSEQIRILSSREMSSFDPKDFAEQLTLIDFGIFKRIHPREFSNNSWQKPNRRIISPNIVASIDFFNFVSHLFQRELLRAQNQEKFAFYFEQIIQIGVNLAGLANYNLLKATVLALSSTSVKRLASKLQVASKKAIVTLENLETMVSDQRNYAYLRSVIEKKPCPCVPYLGLYLKDLAYIEALQETGIQLSNSGAKKLVECLDQILFFQRNPYNSLHVNVDTNHWILSRPYLSEEILEEIGRSWQVPTETELDKEPPAEPPDVDTATEYFDILLDKFRKNSLSKS